MIDCGCGPLGGLAVLSEMVGPAGRVVGVDLSPATVQRARAVVSALGLGNVEVIAGGLHDLDSAALGGPFDLAFTRLFLMHQPDPVRHPPPHCRSPSPGRLAVAHEQLPQSAAAVTPEPGGPHRRLGSDL